MARPENRSDARALNLTLPREAFDYLVLLATAAFIPLEIEELVRRPTIWKALAFVINVAIVAYLIWRKRLFIDRPPPAVTSATTEAHP